MSENAQRIFLWCVAIALILGTAIALKYAPGYRAVAGATGGGELLPPNVSLRLKKLTIKGRKDGKLAWTIKADQLDATRLRDRMDFIGHIEAAFVRDGITRAKITAASAAYTDPPKVLTVSGNLKAVLRGDIQENKPDLRFEAPQVIWNVGAQKVSCPGKVRLDLGEDFVEGKQLEIDLKTQEYKMSKVSGRVMVDEANPNVLSALPSLQGLTP